MDQTNGSIDAATLFGVPGLIAVITGGGSGLGAMMARALDTNGAAKVFVIGRREEMLQKTAKSATNNNIIPVVGDVSSKESLLQCVTEVSKHVDHIDVLIANTGISGPRIVATTPENKPLPFEELQANMWNTDMSEFTNTMHVNISGVYFSVSAFLPLLYAANKLRPSPSNHPRPQVIATSSIGGYNRVPLGSHCYGPSKAGLTHMMKQLATLLVAYDIRVNILAPGIYLSELTQAMYEKAGRLETHDQEGSIGRDVVPATRTGDEQDIAGAILWLCSRAGSYVSGNVLVTDGGRLGVVPASY